MIFLFTAVIVVGIFGPLAWKTSQSPKQATRWMIAAGAEILVVARINALAASWPSDSGENYGELLFIFVGFPIAVSAISALLVCFVRERQWKSVGAAGIALAGVVVHGALIVVGVSR